MNYNGYVGYQPYGQQMQQGYGYQQQTQQAPQQMQHAQQQALSGRMVTSREEALASPADYMAGVTIFPNLRNGEIFVKVVNRDTGCAPMERYVRVIEEKPEETPMQQLEERLRRVETELEASRRRTVQMEENRRRQMQAAEASRREMRQDD